MNVMENISKSNLIQMILESPLNKKTKTACMTIVNRAAFLNDNKYYPQVFLDERLHKI